MLVEKIVILIFFGVFVSGIDAIPFLSQCMGQKVFNPHKIWSRFNATDVNGKESVEYQIRNIPKTRFEEVLSLVKPFLEDEQQSKIKGITEKRIQMHRKRWMIILRDNLSVACFDNSDKMVGVVLLYIGKKPGSKSKRGSPSRISEMGYFDIFEYYGVDEYLANDGLVVLPEYRRRGIAKQLIMTFPNICKENELEVLASVVSSDSINNMANEFEQSGYEIQDHAIENFSNEPPMTFRAISFGNRTAESPTL
ncbi:uncharacterized protein LOC116350223 [Contarinia nasturtii]|uniref:uncharacterized protein LOC116350223 n=1 Tax=Contarinia nasturtii TaxID=265458 RepID=UPI0012D37459|nr:uncharacterized protein LOC116350223 [Contarinia nasturtii]